MKGVCDLVGKGRLNVENARLLFWSMFVFESLNV